MKISKSIVCVIMMTVFVVSLFSAIPAQANTQRISSNTLYVHGSSTVAPISELARQSFLSYIASKFPATTSVDINELGSGAGLTELKGANNMVSGVPTPETDIAASSKQGSSAGLYTIAGTAITDPREFFIGYDSIAIIVPETNTWLTEITPSEVVDLFVATGNNVGTPKYATWGAWGTANQRSVPSDFANKPIACIGREFSSGTYDGFNSFFLANYGCASAYNVNTGILDNNWLSNNYQGKTSNTQVLSAMEDPTNAYGVGFIGLGFIQDDLGSSHPHHVVPLKLYNADTHQYVIPSIQNVVEGAYVCKSGSVIIRPLCYFMDGLPVAGTPEAVKSIWISYIRAHPEFLEADGYIPMPRIDFTGASSGNTGATGTKTVPDKIIDYRDTMYFVQAYQSFFATTVLDPYADLNADGTINYLDTLVYVAEYIACFK